MAVTVASNCLTGYVLQPDQPKEYLFCLIYDKYVSWEFGMKILQTIFQKSYEEADLMSRLLVEEGEVICGLYSHEIAESKARLVEEAAKSEEVSILCLIEEV